MTDELEPRVRILEIKTQKHSDQIREIQGDVKELKEDSRTTRTRIHEIEKTIISITTPLKAVLWVAAIFTASIIALIWSLIIGKTQIIFPY
jgi:hypothetical protein